MGSAHGLHMLAVMSSHFYFSNKLLLSQFDDPPAYELVYYTQICITLIDWREYLKSLYCALELS